MRHFLTQVTLLCRTAVALSTAALSTGCLVSEAPPLKGEELVSPRIVLSGVSPSPLFIVQTTSDTAATPFRAYFWSEDLNQQVVGYLYLDELTRDANLGGLIWDPGSLSDAEPRLMEILWADSRNQRPGCHIMIMTIGHLSDFDPVKQIPYPDAYERVAFVTWTVAHDLPPYEISLEDCPQLGVDQGMN
jgi:hypothetical protein